MDKKKGFLNVAVSLLAKILVLVFTLITRRLIIKYLGNDINGINSLYTSIIGFLSVTELGVGAAIAFSMYGPIVNEDYCKVRSLYQLYKKLYYIIALVIGISGICVMPFLPFLAKGYNPKGTSLYFTFLLALCAVVITYLYSAKNSLINAYKNNYITSLSNCAGITLQSILQIVVLVLYKSFVLFLIATILGTLVQWIFAHIITKQKYPNIINGPRQPLDNTTKREVVKNVKAMFMHKIGNVMVNTIDSIIISAFVGVAILGKYSNYTIISTAIISIISLAFSSLTAIVGHAFVKQTSRVLEEYYDLFYIVNYLLGSLFFLGYYAVIDDLIVLLFGDGLILNSVIVKCVTLNYFVQFLRQSTLLFRDASGAFYNDRWKPIFEGIANLVLSILLVLLLPADYSVAGVILATIVTNLCVCHVVEPHILYKYSFKSSPKKHYIRNYILIVVFCIIMFIFDQIRFDGLSNWINVIVNGSIVVAIWLAGSALMLITNKKTRHKIVYAIKQRKEVHR